MSSSTNVKTFISPVLPLISAELVLLHDSLRQEPIAAEESRSVDITLVVAVFGLDGVTGQQNTRLGGTVDLVG